MLLRERHELERKLADVEDRERCARNNDHELVNRLKRDLKKTRILLHDARLMLQQVKSDAPNKAMLRQLRNQVSLTFRVVCSPTTRRPFSIFDFRFSIFNFRLCGAAA